MTYTTRDDYLTAMKRCRQFAHFDVEPKWNPETPDIDGFIHDEVVRQFHNPAVYYDGGLRIEKMKMAWRYAQKKDALRLLPGVADLIQMAKFIEDINLEGLRHHNIAIGGNQAAPFLKLPTLVAILVKTFDKVDPDRLGELTIPPKETLYAMWRFHHSIPETEFVERFEEFCQHIVTVDDAYLTFELVHPFGDGNGRTGKILYNWLAHTLGDPLLVRDWFGGGNP